MRIFLNKNYFTCVLAIVRRPLPPQKALLSIWEIEFIKIKKVKLIFKSWECLVGSAPRSCSGRRLDCPRDLEAIFLKK